MDDNDDDLIINDKSLHYTRKEDSEAIRNDNNIDNTELRKKSKVSIISSSKKNNKYSIFTNCIKANGTKKKVIRNYF